MKATRCTVTFRDEDFHALVRSAFSRDGVEGAAYVLCRTSVTAHETRLLAREIVPVDDADYLVREPDRLSIASDSYARVAKRAEATGCSVLFVHSHPGGYEEFSTQDDREEPKLMAFLASRAPAGMHGSLVLSGPRTLRGRCWIDGLWREIELVRVVGRRLLMISASASSGSIPAFYDRQVRAFGPDIQRLLGRLHVGIVGAGGTGSASAEQLARLGIGRLTIFDGDTLTKSNVTRVYGSTAADEGAGKAELLAMHVRRIGLGSSVVVIPSHITHEAIAKQLRDCDVVFGCTDKQVPRGILVQLALRYLIPVFDLGVKVESANGVLGGVYGRVTTLLPGVPCLFCRERISSDRIRLESLPDAERRRLAAEGYAPELGEPDPAVVSFTTAVAAQAVTEFLHMLTGFMGPDREATETIMQIHLPRISGCIQARNDDCLCERRDLWGAGDGRDYLGMMWSS